MYLLDTNVVSEMRKIGSARADPHVTAWLAGQDDVLLYVSALTVMELEVGCRLTERRDVRQGRALRSWLAARLAAFGDRLLPMDAVVATRTATLLVPDPRPARDATIAATALTPGLVMVTRNVKDFLMDDLEVINPWQGER